MDMSKRKIMTLRFLNRPFFEMEGRELGQFLVEVMFNAEKIQKGEEPSFPYNQVEDPMDLASNLINDLQREISLRN
jgi:hypothetical protein